MFLNLVVSPRRRRLALFGLDLEVRDVVERYPTRLEQVAAEIVNAYMHVHSNAYEHTHARARAHTHNCGSKRATPVLKKASIGLPLPFCRFASLCSFDTCIHGQAPVEVRVRLGLAIGGRAPEVRAQLPPLSTCILEGIEDAVEYGGGSAKAGMNGGMDRLCGRLVYYDEITSDFASQDSDRIEYLKSITVRHTIQTHTMDTHRTLTYLCQCKSQLCV